MRDFILMWPGIPGFLCVVRVLPGKRLTQGLRSSRGAVINFPAIHRFDFDLLTRMCRNPRPLEVW